MFFNEALVVPTLAGGISEATVTRLFVEPERPGKHIFSLRLRLIIKPLDDYIRTGDPVIELSTGQVIMAPIDGHLEWCVPVGTNVTVGAEIGEMSPHAKPPYLRTFKVPGQEALVLGNDLDRGEAVTATMEQLCSGCYILGVQGMGKSSLLEEIARQLLDKDESVIIFDPHGQLIDDIVARMPARRLADTYHLNLKDRKYPCGLNVFACADPNNEEERDRTRNQVTHAFEKLWPETRTGVYFKKLLRHIIILLIEHPQLTLADVPRILRDTAFRTGFTQSLRNSGSRDFWRYDYGALSPARQITESGPLLTRVDELLAEPVITRILCQPHSTINIRSLIEQRKNLFIRLPINEDAYAKAAEIVGTMLMAMVYAATFSFADVAEEKRPGFSLIVDEFQNFATDEYARLFAQGRKFKAKQFLAHQYRDQLAEAAMEANKAATLTAQTKIVFAVNKADALAVAEEFVPFEQSRRPVNLNVSPLSSLDRHPDPVVKEFGHLYGRALEEGTTDKEISFPRTSRNRDDKYVFIPPSRDFGGGRVSFGSWEARGMVADLNALLYSTEKAGTIDTVKEEEVVKRMQKFFPDYSGKREEATDLFARRLHGVLEALLAAPITIGRSTTSSKDVAITLQHQPKRQAYVRIGASAYAMETLEIGAPVDTDEAQQRFEQLRDQTRQQLCRHASGIDAERSAPPAEEPEDPPTPVQDPAQPPQQGHRRRSKPLP
jgi:uncharacterized protein DUF87